MAITKADLTSGTSNTDASTYTDVTASITPTAGRLVICFVGSDILGGSPAEPTVTGCGLTWHKAATEINGDLRISCSWGWAASPSTGKLTFAFGATQEVIAWSVFELIGTNLSLPVIQTNSATGTSTSPTVTLSAYQHADNAVIAGIAHALNSAVTAGTNFTEIHEIQPDNGVGRRWTFETEWNATNDADTSVDWTTSNRAFAAIALEIAILQPVTATPTTLALSTAAFAPSIRLGVKSTPTTKALSLATFAPVVSAPRLVTPSTLALVMSLLTPTVSTPRLATPSTLSLILSTFAPSTHIDRTLTPTTLALMTNLLAPTISTPRLVTPSTLALILSTLAPTVLTPRLVTPSTLSLILNLLTPVPFASNHQMVTPTTLALTLSTFAPTIFTIFIKTLLLQGYYSPNIFRFGGQSTIRLTGYSKPAIYLAGNYTPEPERISGQSSNEVHLL